MKKQARRAPRWTAKLEGAKKIEVRELVRRARQAKTPEGARRFLLWLLQQLDLNIDVAIERDR